jgi:hypothetical protein
MVASGVRPFVAMKILLDTQASDLAEMKTILSASFSQDCLGGILKRQRCDFIANNRNLNRNR